MRNRTTSLSFLQSGLPGARWIEQVDMHITLRFIGDVDPPLARELAEAFETVKFPTLELELDNLDPLLDLLEDPSILILTHAGENDYRLFSSKGSID